MFTEDIGLLPGHMFTRMLRHAHPASERFPELAGERFRGMASRRRIGSRPWPGSTTACSTNGVPVPLERSHIETGLASVGPRRVGDRPVDPSEHWSSAAAPEEVEEAVNVRTEEATQGIDGIKRIQSTASEGMDTVMIELDLGADARRVVDEVKSNIDAITTFPFQAEKPIIRELTNRAQVVDIAVSGDVDPVHAEAGHGNA